MAGQGEKPDIDNPELSALTAEALDVDGLIAPAVSDVNQPGDTEAALPVVDRLAEAKTLIGILKPLVMMAFPVVKDAPADEWDALTQPAADCLAFYDVDVSKWLAHPLAALAFASVPLVMRGVNNWQAAHDTKPDTPDTIPGPVEVPGAPAPQFQSRA